MPSLVEISVYGRHSTYRPLTASFHFKIRFRHVFRDRPTHTVHQTTRFQQVPAVHVWVRLLL